MVLVLLEVSVGLVVVVGAEASALVVLVQILPHEVLHQDVLLHLNLVHLLDMVYQGCIHSRCQTAGRS